MTELIVCERDGSWATALAQRLAGTDLRIRQTRSLAAAGQELSGAPASCLVVALDVSKLEEVIQFLSVLERRFPAAVGVAVAPRKYCAATSGRAKPVRFISRLRRGSLVRWPGWRYGI